MNNSFINYNKYTNFIQFLIKIVLENTETYKKVSESTTTVQDAQDTPIIRARAEKPKKKKYATNEQRKLAEKYSINGMELDAILRAHGTSQVEFGKAIELSNQAVCNWCNDVYKKIRYKYAKKLEEVVGEDIYATTLDDIRNKSLKRTKASEGIK